ncbi:MAG: hypothetical protein R3D25_16405 [Geminicoccaceae bacterium]
MAENGRTYFDRQEVREPGERERSIFHALPGLIRHAIDNAPFFREQLAGIEPDSITSLPPLARLPVARKAALSVAAASSTRPSAAGHGDRAPRPSLRDVRDRVRGRRQGRGPAVYHPEAGARTTWRFGRACMPAGQCVATSCSTASPTSCGRPASADFGARAWAAR